MIYVCMSLVYFCLVRQIKLAVLIFLETWLVHFTEDFMFSALEVSGMTSPRPSPRPSPKVAGMGPGPYSGMGGSARDPPPGGCKTNASVHPSGSSSSSSDTVMPPVGGRMMNDLVEFLRSVARCPYMELLGVVFQGKQDGATHKAVKAATSLSDLLILPDSQFEKHFPCISKLLQVRV